MKNAHTYTITIDYTATDDAHALAVARQIVRHIDPAVDAHVFGPEELDADTILSPLDS